MNDCRLYVLAGCTATGKTEVAQAIAEREGWPILSADAMLVYRGMTVGTAKPSADQRARVRYFGIDFVDPAETSSAGAWLEQAATACHAAAADERPLLVVGGTGLYLKLLLHGLDAPAADPARRRHWLDVQRREGTEGLRRALMALDASRLPTDPHNPRRLIRALELAEHPRPPDRALPPSPPTPPIAGLRLPRAQLHARIAARIEAMWAKGLLDEVRNLREPFAGGASTALQAIGYREALDLLDGRLTPETAKAQMALRTRRLAKRQETWFRHQISVDWVDIPENEPPGVTAARVRSIWSTHGPVILPLEHFQRFDHH